ncbi:hypothetical protein CLAFUW4_11282 [Fulvia fulva]|uniref:Uncharacterized protein n=1 Tax=Passalora fulva TaxID=5499 RepID=A0A9Q8PCW3_PASFU|nr:uncharacterized protein CLAFUR5_10323 [Fulvia fulva]KAK4620108.1 hypothetical protein CLAFUR4_11288 [Fulvia fulva]KAK4620961.1 hypothetical protein CLAFUR0_11293 [Fulvia fulva]UJO20102.1 hypothetical protein CLAFUR5_10323 [Fulvia fulva]WPV17507.1 hypothetical protein CLAFUW4_11282 [Fulvia fulva]WPV32421.1 hypothetical protein CLAFUW7_11278 [Fulvia fulva]
MDARWQHTNLDALRTLKLKDNVDAGTLEWTAKHANFPSLSALEIRAGSGGNRSDTATLLQSLPSLNELAFTGDVCESTLSAIVSHHGHFLRRLPVPRSASTIESLQILRKACPLLEHLGVRILRTQGDKHEAGLYTCLGSFTKVRSLCLDLDCSITVHNENTLDDLSWSGITQDPTYKELCTRRVLVNCAIDAALVTAIFRRIAAAKPKSSTRLQSIEFNVVGVGTICFSDAQVSAGELDSRYSGFDTTRLYPLYQHFERQWKCALSPRDDEPDGIITEELKGSQARRMRYEDILGGRPPEMGDAEPEFCALWPREPSQDWRDVWSSLPLAEA